MFWKKTGKKITIQGSDVAGFDKSKVECFNYHKMGHFARECRAPRSQDRGKREIYKHGPKEEQPAPKALMAIDGLPEFVNDTVIDDSRPTPGIDASKCNTSDLQSNNFSVYEHGESLEKEKTWPKNNFAHKNVTPRAVLLKTGRTPITISRPNMNVAQPKLTSFAKTTHSNVKRHFQGKLAVRTQSRVPRISTVTEKILTVDSKFSTAKSTLTADLGNKGKAVKASACWIWRPE
nr:hypothetical protein [Tanacetum cinerariifolium]